MSRGTMEEWLEAMALTRSAASARRRRSRSLGAAPLAGAVREDAGMIEFTLDGSDRAPGGRAARARGGTQRRLHPDALPRRQARAVRRLPDVRRRRRGCPRPLPACATRVTEGMVVSTNSNVPQLRKTLTEMLLAEHLNADPGGRPNELTDLADELGATAPFLLPDAKREPYADRNKLMGYEPDTCILCNRCVRYTQEVMQCSALSLEGAARGADRADLGAELARHRVRALRRLPLHLPDRRDLREVPRGAGSRSAPRAGEDDLHLLRRRLPARPQRRSGRSGSSR